ncbi:MAG: SRPBCC family protein [Chloroflexia bacterium]
MYSQKVRPQTTINVPREEVFDFLVNPQQIPLVLPGLIENTDVPELPLKVGDTFTYHYQVSGVMLEGTWTITELEKPSVYAARTTGGGDSEWRYTLRDEGKGTHLDLTVTYDPPKSVLQKIQVGVLEKIVEKDAETYMQNLKTLLENRGS